MLQLLLLAAAVDGVVVIGTCVLVLALVLLALALVLVLALWFRFAYFRVVHICQFATSREYAESQSQLLILIWIRSK